MCVCVCVVIMSDNSSCESLTAFLKSLSVATQKWQRRFFVLYEHGLLRYALDEMVSNPTVFTPVYTQFNFVHTSANPCKPFPTSSPGVRQLWRCWCVPSVDVVPGERPVGLKVWSRLQAPLFLLSAVYSLAFLRSTHAHVITPPP